MIKHLAGLACALLAASPIWAAADDPESDARPLADPSERLFVLLEAERLYTAPQLSPSGRYILYFARLNDEGEHALRVTDLEAEDGPASWSLPLGSVDPLWARWASEDRVLAAIAVASRITARPGREPPGPTSRIISLDRDLRTEPVVLFSGEGRRVNLANPSLTHVADFLTDDPDHILMPANRGSRHHLWRVNVLTGDAEVVELGGSFTIAWRTIDGSAVLRVDIRALGSRLDIFTREPGRADWNLSLQLPLKDIEEQEVEFEWAGETDSAHEVLVRVRPGDENFMGIYRFDLQTGEIRDSVAVRDDYDIANVLIDPYSGQFLGYGYIDNRRRYHFQDEEFARHYEALAEFFGDQIELHPLSVSGDHMILRADGPTELGSIYLYDIAARDVQPIYALWPEILETELFEVETIRYRARDGLELQAYVTWPAQGPGPDTPLIVLPHGGPEARDRVSFGALSQYFATAGYAVLQPDFRGSWGYGRAFVEAGFHQWGLAMQDDISDGVLALTGAGRADPDRVCIVGASYGGYAALTGAVRTPELYRCAVAANSVSDLPLFLDHVSRGNEETYAYWVDWLGEYSGEHVARLDATSPARRAGEISIPVMLFHGANDRVVSVEQSRVMSRALTEAGVWHVYLEEPGVGHHYGDGDTRRRNFRNIRRFIDAAMADDARSFEPELAN